MTAPPIGRVYGRRRVRRVDGHKAELLDTVLKHLTVPLPPAPGMIKPHALFDHAPKDIWLEIGFGGGEHLAAQAALHPEIGLIGCEPFINGVSALLGLLEQGGQSNVRVLGEDARLLLQALPEASLTRVFVLFPDPWPKRRHEDRRFLTAHNLDMLARVLKDDAELRVATDHAALGEWIEDNLAGHAAFQPIDRWRERPESWPPTRYEAKALKVGRQPVYLSFARVKRA